VNILKARRSIVAEAVVYVSMAGRRVDGSAGSGEYVSMAGRERINARSAGGICEHGKGRVNSQGNAEEVMKIYVSTYMADKRRCARMLENTAAVYVSMAG
jgi:hypothetical protein